MKLKPTSIRALAALALTFGTLTASAQNAATVAGNVKDEKGHPLGGASIVLRGQKTSDKRETKTAEDGTFSVGQLPPDSYQISASQGESDATAIVDLGAGQSRNVTLVIDTSSTASLVALDNSAATIETSSARLGSNVTASETGALPVNGRTFGPLALSAPFVVSGGTASVESLRVAGQSIEQTSYLLDGVDASSVVVAYPGFLPVNGQEFRLGLSVENVQEFRINAAAYPAEQGGGTGAQIALVSKSGANEWHGAAFEYFRNNAIADRNFFDNDGRNLLQMNQFGADAGGSIKKDKLFVFGSFERLRQAVGSDILEQVPSVSSRLAAEPSVAAWVASIPIGVTNTSDPGVDLSRRSAVARQNEGTYTARVDYLRSATNRIALRYSRNSGTLTAPDTTTTARDITGSAHPDQTVFTWSASIGEKLNLLTLGLNRSPESIGSSYSDASLASQRVVVGAGDAGGLVSPGGLIQLFDGTYGRGAEYRGKSYNAADDLDWEHGSHSFKAGVDVRLIRAPFRTLGGIVYNFRDDDSFLSNEDADVHYSGDLPFRHAASEEYGAFFRDLWKIHPNLVLNMGVRYEYLGATREINDLALLLNPFTMAEHAASGGFYHPSKFMLQPRVSVSWAPERWKDKTVFRAGVGLYDGPFAFLETLAPIGETVPHAFLRGSVLGQTPGSILNNPETLNAPEALDLSSFGKSQRNVVYTASIQQALPFKLVAQAAYLGIGSHHLTQGSVSNLSIGVNSVSGDVIRPDASTTAVPYLTNGGTSSYNALQLGVSRRFVDDLTISTSYNWSHSIGTSLGAGDAQAPQNPNCLACERADNNFDIRQTLSFNFVYDLPFGVHRPHLATGAISKFAGGWSMAGGLNVHTGLPVNVTMSRPNEIYYSPSQHQYFSASADLPADAFATVNTPGGGEDRASLRPNYVAGVSPYLTSGGVAYLNPAAFAVPLPGTFGDLGRNALRGPGLAQLDLQITRSFHFGEKLALKVRAEAFNLFNHPNFANPTALLPDSLIDAQPGTRYNSVTSAGFGQLISTAGRTVGLGTSRQFQLSMRLEF